LTVGDWRDWLPDEAPEPPLDELLTRDQLLVQLNDDGVKVTAYDLENWQRTGIIPRGIRRWHRRQDGSGATESFYPRWMADVIRHLRALQGEGFKLAYVGPRLREIAAHDTAHVRVREEATVTKMLTDDDGLLAPAVEAVEAYARRERMTPVAIMFRDKDGFEHAFPLPDAPRSC
jgi:hypothetical protein